MTDINFNNKYKSDADYEKHCRTIYGMHSRTINSIVREVKGIMKAYMELKKTELAQLVTKITAYEKKVKKIDPFIWIETNEDVNADGVIDEISALLA